MDFAFKSRALEVNEILDLVLLNVTDCSDLARCVRVNKQWHFHGIKHLWKGGVNKHTNVFSYVPLDVLGRLSNDPFRFRHYARHIRHLRIILDRNVISGGNAAFNRFLAEYERILQPGLWTSCELVSLDLPLDIVELCRQPQLPTEPLLALLQPRLRMLQISGCRFTPPFVAALKAIPLRWLSFRPDPAVWNDRSLCDFLQAQSELVGLELKFQAEDSNQYVASISAAAKLEKLRHFSTNLQGHATATTWDTSGHWFSTVESLTIKYTSFSSQVLARTQDLTRLRHIHLWAEMFEGTEIDNPPELSVTLRQLSLLSNLEQVVINNHIADDLEDSDIDGAVRAFAQSLPLLRKLRVDCNDFVDQMSDEVLSDCSLIYLIQQCPRLEFLEYNHKISGEAIKIIHALAMGAPQLLKLTLRQLSLDLRTLAELPPSDVVLRLQWFYFDRMTMAGADSMSSTDVQAFLEQLVARLPYLRRVPSHSFHSASLVGQALNQWNALRGAIPILDSSLDVYVELRHEALTL